MITQVGGLAREFLWRELRTRFAGSISGGLWAVFQPLIQLNFPTFAPDELPPELAATPAVKPGSRAKP